MTTSPTKAEILASAVSPGDNVEAKRLAKLADQVIGIQTKQVQAPHSVGPLDYAEVERLAALGLVQRHIAFGIGLTEQAWHTIKARDARLREACERGAHTLRQKVAKLLEDHAVKHFIPAMFLAKQPHVLDYIDGMSNVRHSGSVELVITPAEEAMRRRKEADQAIEVEYQEVTGD